MTRVKIGIARILYHFLRIFLKKDRHQVRRKGVCYEVDLSEGIDLSLFLFGNFQNYVTQSKYFSINADAIIFDIGANIGSMTFRYAQAAPNGHVFAFEPTDYAFKKLNVNLSLNAKLAQRITPIQLFLSDRSCSDHQIEAYASWKIDGSAQNPHPLHGGSMKTAGAVPAVTLDDFCKENGIQHIDLIKIDTDGHELQVLKGAQNSIKIFRPYVIFEIGLYVMQEQEIEFEQFYSYFTNFGYNLLNAKNGKIITLQNFSAQIPWRSTTDIIARPPSNLYFPGK